MLLVCPYTELLLSFRRVPIRLLMMLQLLVVEDDVHQAAAIGALFEQSSPGTRVTHSRTLREALSHDRSTFDVILVDLGLPDSSGLDTLAAVRDRYPAMPVVVLTATDDEALSEAAIERGADDYLVKGVISARSIRRVVRRAAERNVHRRATEERIAQNAALAELGRLALADVDLDTLFDTTCRVAANVLHVPNAALVELTGDRHLFVRAMPDHPRRAIPLAPTRLDEATPAGLCIRTDAPVRVDDIRSDPRFPPHPILDLFGVVSALAVSFHGATSGPEGALVVWSDQPKHFDDHAVAFLGAASNILAAGVQREEAEKALRAHHEVTAQILDAIPDRVIRYGRDLRPMYSNRAAAAAARRAEHEPLPARWKTAMERVLASRVAERLDIVSEDGTVHLEASLVPMKHDDSDSVVIVARDITDRVRMQSRFETLFASNMIGVVFSDLEGVITQANDAFLQVVGRARTEVAARSLRLDDVTPTDARTVQSEKLRRSSTVMPYRTSLQRPDGTRVPVLLASAAVAGVSGEIVSFVIDETATRKVEDLVENQMLLLNGARDAIMLRDAEGRITFWTEGAARMYGWTAQEAVGRSAFELLYTSDVDKVRAIHEVALSRGAWQGELVQVRKDGRQIVVDSRWSVIEGLYGENPIVLVINTDVTEKKSLERQLLHAQRLESLGTLAGGVAHDLNNILMPIRLGAEYLRRVGLPPAGDATVDRIEVSAKRASELIRQMLTFARGHRAENEMTNPQRLVDEVERVLRETLPPSIQITSSVDPDIWSLACDPTQVHQVLLNLGINARDAIGERGAIVIAAANAAVDDQYARMNVDATPGAYVMLSVTDTGSGIPSDVLPRIFEPFFTTKDPGIGTGLGLATVRSIVRNHRGFINVYSEPGRTVFKVYFPALHEQPPEEEAPAEPVRAGNGELVLIIDDEEAIREITAATLRSYGYDVISAADGSEGVALYAQNPKTAVVLTDMLMPILDGPTTIRALRRVNPNVRIIGMSGFASRPGNGPHPDILLQKPFRAADLLSAIQSVLGGGTFRG